MREGRAEPCPYGVGMQKNRPYQLDIYTVSFHAIPRQAREQGGFDRFLRGDAKGRSNETKGRYKENKKGDAKGNGKGKEKQAVSAIIRESGAFWERPKRTGVKRRVKA